MNDAREEPVSSNGNGHGDTEAEGGVRRIAREEVEKLAVIRIGQIESDMKASRADSKSRHAALLADHAITRGAVVLLGNDVRANHGATLDGLDRIGSTVRDVKAWGEAFETKVMRELGPLARARGRLDSLAEDVTGQHNRLALVDAKAERAKIAAYVRIPALMGAGAALWKLFELLYPLIH